VKSNGKVLLAALFPAFLKTIASAYLPFGFLNGKIPP